MNELSTASNLIEACWRYLLLGIIQGITEFLPISSTAHLKVLPIFFGWEDPGVSVSAVIQLGSILAVFAYFKKELRDLLKGVSRAFKYGQWQEPRAKLGFAIFAGSMPIILAGMFIKIFWPGFEDSCLRSIPSIAIVSILMALLLVIAENIGKQNISLANISIKQSFFIGIGQILALIPGASRSGITLSTALLNGFKRQDAAKFSFLLGIPSITIAGIVELKNSYSANSIDQWLPIIIGILSSAIVSWLTIDWLLNYLKRNNTLVFVIYRLIFGFVLLCWWLVKTPY